MFGWFKRVRRDDPIFGCMLFMGGKRKPYWEGKAHFSPTGTVIEVMVDGASDANMTQQHEFFVAVCKMWDNLSPILTTTIQQEYAHSSKEVLRLSALSIPNSHLSGDAEWDVSFSTQGNSHYTVHMKGLTPETVEWDT